MQKKLNGGANDGESSTGLLPIGLGRTAVGGLRSNAVFTSLRAEGGR